MFCTDASFADDQPHLSPVRPVHEAEKDLLDRGCQLDRDEMALPLDQSF